MSNDCRSAVGPFAAIGRRIAGVAVATNGFALLALVGCGGGGGPSARGTGTTTPAAFRAVAASPADGASGVKTDVKITVLFSLPVDRNTLSSGTLSLVSSPAGVFSGAVGFIAGSNDRQLEFLHPARLAEGTTYSLIISPALRSTSGDALGGLATFIFRTEGSGKNVTPPPAWSLHPTIGRMVAGRRNHTATLMPDGYVLLCGGFVRGTAITARAELFDVPAEVFVPVPRDMTSPRAGHTATVLLDGRVLITGGYYESSPGVLNVTDSAELYDPHTATFLPVGSMVLPRADHAALRLPDGRVLVTGGSELIGGFLFDHATAEVFDPLTGAWSEWLAPLSHTRSSHRMVDLADGRFLLVGGSDLDFAPETFRIADGTFEPFAPAPNDRARFGAAVASFASGNWAIVGGEQYGDVLYFSRADTRLRNTGSPTTRPRTYATASRIAPDRVLVAGGIDIPNGGVIQSSCDLVVEGGLAGSGTYATSIRFPTGMADHTATTLPDGRILFAGGLNPFFGQPELDGAYLFVP